jgi:hypothetical protein
MAFGRHPHFELRGRLNNELSKALIVFAIGDWRKTERLGDHAFAKQGWIQEGSTSAPTFMKDTSRMISSSPTFRKTSSVYGRCDRFACRRIALVPTLDLDTTHLYGTGTGPT